MIEATPGDMAGVLLGDLPNDHPRRARLRITPLLDRRTLRTKALRVRVFSDPGGLALRDIRVTQSEITMIEVPQADGTLAKFPGSLWFYGRDLAVGFLPDSNAGALLLHMAVEKPRKGPTAPPKPPEPEHGRDPQN